MTVADEEDPEATWKQFSFSTVRSHVQLTCEPRSEQKFAEFLRGTPLYKQHLQGHAKIAVLFDLKTSGESKWQPNVRTPSLRDEYYEKLIRGALRGFTTGFHNEWLTPYALSFPDIWSSF